MSTRIGSSLDHPALVCSEIARYQQDAWDEVAQDRLARELRKSSAAAAKVTSDVGWLGRWGSFRTGLFHEIGHIGHKP